MFRKLTSAGLVGTMLRQPFKLIPRNSVVRIWSGPLRGRKWITGSSVASCWLGLYEAEKLAEMEAHLRRGGVFVDIGAQAGYHTLLASLLVGSPGAVYAFEPLPRNHEYLLKHLAINDIFNVQPVRAAVSDQVGELRFDPGPGFMAGHLSAEGAVTVQCVTLDGWLEAEERRVPTAIKIDVEGAELRVLRGAERTLRTHKPVVMVDTHDFLGGDKVGLHDACCAFLSKCGYELSCTLSTAPNKASSILAVAPVAAGAAG